MPKSYRVHFTVGAAGLSPEELRAAFGDLASPAYGFTVQNGQAEFHIDVYNVEDEEQAIEGAVGAADEFLLEAAHRTGKEPPEMRVKWVESLT